MQTRVVEFRSGKGHRFRAREQRTLETMMGMYCRAHHVPGKAAPCPECMELAAYARRRLERCVFGDEKPTCANCLVHCYKAEMRERVRAMMRWSGPRMLLTHPWLAIRHLVDGRRPSPRLPGAQPR